jgi:stage V sporulation protein B
MTLNAILNYFFIHWYGIVGSAIATTISSFIVMVISTLYTRRIFGSIMPIANIGKLIVAGICFFLLSLFFPAHKYLFILWSAILSLIYLFIIYFLRILRHEDIRVIMQIVKKKKT